jgi:hypothetical protein
VAARAPALLCHAMAEIVHNRVLSPFIDVSLHGVEREPFTRYSVLVVFFFVNLTDDSRGRWIQPSPWPAIRAQFFLEVRLSDRRLLDPVSLSS